MRSVSFRVVGMGVGVVPFIVVWEDLVLGVDYWCRQFVWENIRVCESRLDAGSLELVVRFRCSVIVCVVLLSRMPVLCLWLVALACYLLLGVWSAL